MLVPGTILEKGTWYLFKERMEMGTFVKVITTDQVPPGEGRLVEAQGREIALFNLGGTFYAINNTCAHAGGPLGEGAVEGEEVECPWHGARFNVKTGAVLAPPAGEGVASLKVRINGSNVEVEIE